MGMVIDMQEKHSSKKGCAFFMVHISSDNGKDVNDAEILKRYLVFIIVLGCIPRKDIRVTTS